MAKLLFQHTGRYRDILLLVAKYAQADFVKDMEIDGITPESEDMAPPPQQLNALGTFNTSPSDSLADDLERMGPVFIKLGQLLSTRADIIPAVYLESLSRLQDQISPIGADAIRTTIEDELGGRISKLFSNFEDKPLATASLGQVHRAQLRDGRMVVVKVQRPGVRTNVVEDLEALTELATFMHDHNAATRKFELLSIVEELRKSLTRELDYVQEAQNLQLLGDHLKEFTSIVVPQPILDYTTSRVLTMEHIQGQKITAVSPLEWTELDGTPLAEQLFQAYLKQLLVDGFFHADPHPGNVWLTDDRKIALLDLGMVARIPQPLQESLVRLLLAISEGRGGEAAEIAEGMGEIPREGFNRYEFRRRIAELVMEHESASLGRLDMGRVIMQIPVVAADTGIKLSPALNMLGKALMNLDKIGRTLSPQFDPNRAIRDHASKILRQRLEKGLSLGNVYTALLDVNDLLHKLPSRVSKIVELVAENEIRIRVDAIDEIRLLGGMQKIANRITMGLVLAALIIAAALLVRVSPQRQFLADGATAAAGSTLFGYPALALIFFVAAAAGGVLLIGSIIVSDERAKPKR